MSDSSVKRLVKVQAVTAFLLTAIAILWAASNPASGYEASIYTALPIYLWIALLFLMIGGITVVIHQIFSGGYKTSKLWLVGVFQILLAYAISLSLHLIRGYYMWGMCGDAATHLGNINAIVSFNAVPGSLHYPIIHIYSSTFMLFSGVNSVLLHLSLPLIYSLLFVLFMFVFSREVLPRLSQRIFALVLSCFLIHESYIFFTPNNFANLTFPILLYLLAKINVVNLNSSSDRVEYRFLAILLVFMYPALHTVAILAFITVIFGLIFSDRVTGYIEQLFKKTPSFQPVSRADYSFLLGFTIIWLIIWLSSFSIWDVNISNTFNVLTGGGTSSLSLLVAKSDYAASYGYNPFVQIIKQYGAFILFTMLTSIAVLLLRRDLKGSDINTTNLFQFWVPTASLLIMMGLLFFIRFNFSPLRLIFFAVTIMVPFVAHLVDRTAKWAYAERRYHKVSKLVAIVLIVGMIVIYAHGLVRVYPSPYILQNNFQTSQQEIEGMRWIFEERNSTTGLSGISAAPGRIMDALYYQGYRESEDISLYLRSEEMVPYHFGYSTNRTLFESYPREAYMLLSERDRRMYAETYPTMANVRWLQEDFNRLYFDPSLNHLYSSREFDVWRIFNA